MSGFRIYRLDESNRIVERIDLAEASESEATAMALTSASDGAVELWQFNKFVVRFSAAMPPQPRHSQGYAKGGHSSGR